MEFRRRLFITDYCLTPYQNIKHCGILCEGNKILAVGGASGFSKDSDVEIVNLEGTYATPGFIDAHIHGSGTFDSSRAYEKNADIESMCTILAAHGVTSFVPTIVSGPMGHMLSAIDSLVSMMDKKYYGAEPVGIHLEGPFLSKKKHGSQLEDHILEHVDMGIARELVAAGKGRIKTITFAPELSGAIELVTFLRENGISPSMGHSSAKAEEVFKAIDAGSLRCTHVYNGMPPLHHRDISLTAIALTDDRVSIEIIADGSHINPRMVDLACRTKPKDKIIGVSDAVQGAGMKDGTYHLGDAEINVREGISRTSDGIIAGTAMTLEIGWHHLVTYSHMENCEAAKCFTVNPARDLSLDDRGEIRPGRRADISFFNKQTNKTALTVSRGKIVYHYLGKLTEKD